MKKRALIGTLIAVPALLIGSVADAKPPSESDRSTSTFNVVAADFGAEGEGWFTYGHVEAYENASGAYIGYFEMNGQEICDPGDPENPDDDLWVNYWFQTSEENEVMLPADFTTGKRNSSAHVEGAVFVNFQYDNPCEEGEGGETELHVVIDLESNGLRVKYSSYSSEAGPDGSTTDKYTFSGNGATGTVTVDGWDPFDAEGQIGTATTRSTRRAK